MVQAFRLCQRYRDDFKVIFEWKLSIDLGRPIAFNTNGQSASDNVVIFDIETTGFSPGKDRIRK